MRCVFSVDRIEGDIAVCISDEDHQVDLPLESLSGLGLHDVFSAEYKSVQLTDIVPMPEEKERRLKSNRDRLKKLLERSKK